MKNQTAEIGRLYGRLLAQITVFAEIKHEQDVPHMQNPTCAHANKQHY